QQIAAGRPVTVTQPEVTRYFMTIPEACQLILHSVSLDDIRSAVYALDMGRPVAIRELAEQMIRLSGKRPGIDIAVTCTGLRPGEKLHEILFDPAERYQRTRHPRILRALPRGADPGRVRALPTRTEQRLAAPGSHEAVVGLPREAAPGYRHCWPGWTGGWRRPAGTRPCWPCCASRRGSIGPAASIRPSKRPRTRPRRCCGSCPGKRRWPATTSAAGARSKTPGQGFGLLPRRLARDGDIPAAGRARAGLDAGGRR